AARRGRRMVRVPRPLRRALRPHAQPARGRARRLDRRTRQGARPRDRPRRGLPDRQRRREGARGDRARTPAAASGAPPRPAYRSRRAAPAPLDRVRVDAVLVRRGRARLRPRAREALDGRGVRPRCAHARGHEDGPRRRLPVRRQLDLAELRDGAPRPPPARLRRAGIPARRARRRPGLRRPLHRAGAHQPRAPPAPRSLPAARSTARAAFDRRGPAVAARALRRALLPGGRGVIRVLPPEVVNQIAAGEVVERPFSVVKELVESALDAGATTIRVEIEDGGCSRIRVVDDGCGFTRADLELAFVSHATSQPPELRDLEHIASLGFRGEALASIGSVARATIRSRTAEGDTGWEIECTGGALSAPRPCGCPLGTQIDVRDLFFNTPARRRFLRTPRAE